MDINWYHGILMDITGDISNTATSIPKVYCNIIFRTCHASFSDTAIGSYGMHILMEMTLGQSPTENYLPSGKLTVCYGESPLYIYIDHL
jgi:hypothetical protein